MMQPQFVKLPWILKEMPISDKTRKILWGRSGNKCAICRHSLVVDATGTDDESVIGDECHIVSGKSLGPRHDPQFPADRLNEPENLILLCRVHHKMVDDQYETYSTDVLQGIRGSTRSGFPRSCRRSGNLLRFES